MKRAFDENLPRMKPHLRLETDPTASTFLPTEPDPEEHGHAAPSIDVPHGAAEALLSAAEGLARHRARNIVLDPVTIASSGDSLLGGDVLEVLRSKLIPLALVVTPNLPEAAALTDASLARNEQEMEAQAREILSLGARNVLIKGGHNEGDECVDLLIGQGEVVRLCAKRIATKNTHGTGCTLSSAIAAGLAKGRDVVTACQEAKAYVTAAIAHADQLEIGHGPGPLHHFYRHWSTP